MKHKRNWIIAIILSAAAGFVALQNVAAPTHDAATPDAVITITAETTLTGSETITPIYEGCSYVWGYHDAPELTEKVDAAVRAMNEQASARASLFGEDCIFADGQSTFGAMETDFYVRLPVADLTAEAAFGDWMAQVLPIITQIPREQMQGNYGFVEFWFEKNDAEFIILRVPIQRYLDEGRDKTGPDLFHMFNNPP
ncbi:MAG: hypothetical protein Q8O48_07555 [Anaerolineales bacterium]|nr:hypothetical protein [Anaerolineales bacterium]